ncbi:hypothetical protein [Nocardia grenadensis]|uniref:hypothetical protein n=1 Tax=Nocardia grenadensis TaxID=931537 RepID=UPI0007A40AAF|nr:hypothetical protein [Nocardia grenadensis]
MTDRPWARDLQQQTEEFKRRYHRQFVARLPVTAVLALTGVSMYVTCAIFGMRWARLAGASNWEAAVWPVAVTSTTTLAVYCWVRLVPEWYPSEARWLFATVATAGAVLAMGGSTLYIADLPQQLHPSAATLVKGVPGFCMILSGAMAATFLRASRPPENPLGAMLPASGPEVEPQA